MYAHSLNDLNTEVPNAKPDPEFNGEILAAIVPRAEAADSSEGSNVSGETKRVAGRITHPVKQNTWRIQNKDNPVINADWNKPAWQSVAPLTLEYYMGKEPAAHQPKTQARAAYDDQYIYIIWKVDDNYVLGKRTQHQQDVWRGSLCGILLHARRRSNSGYFNLETNCCGFKLLNAHFPDRDEYIFTEDDFATIHTASSLKPPLTRRPQS